MKLFFDTGQGVRFWKTDLVLLILGGSIGYFLYYQSLYYYSYLLAYVLLHYFLFCNIVRLRFRLEVLWACLFFANTSICVFQKVTLLDSFFWQIPVTITLLVFHVRSKMYSGIFSQRK
ncbi:MAG: hypothetical protein AAF518_02100 [Spirochaetota bacterium]